MDIKAGINKYVSVCWESEGTSGRAQRTEKPTSLDGCLQSINYLVSDVVPQGKVHINFSTNKTADGDTQVFAQIDLLELHFLQCHLVNNALLLIFYVLFIYFLSVASPKVHVIFVIHAKFQ